MELLVAVLELLLFVCMALILAWIIMAPVLLSTILLVEGCKSLLRRSDSVESNAESKP